MSLNTLQKYDRSQEEFIGAGGDAQDWVNGWSELSRLWAEHAETETTLATCKEGPDPNSFYRLIEEPVLKKRNVKITLDDSHPKERTT
ncbi:hypothetical protein E4U54_008824 [Claviceps lovelessii]|nr:hypothetical protein E4U54_008824 [Claviceps lovelessii]